MACVGVALLLEATRRAVGWPMAALAVFAANDSPGLAASVRQDLLDHAGAWPGLHAALDTLRLSPRNTVAIGDRENDHELLRLAEVGQQVLAVLEADERGHRLAIGAGTSVGRGTRLCAHRASLEIGAGCSIGGGNEWIATGRGKESSQFMRSVVPARDQGEGRGSGRFDW